MEHKYNGTKVMVTKIINSKNIIMNNEFYVCLFILMIKHLNSVKVNLNKEIKNVKE